MFTFLFGNACNWRNDVGLTGLFICYSFTPMTLFLFLRYKIIGHSLWSRSLHYNLTYQIYSADGLVEQNRKYGSRPDAMFSNKIS